MKNVHLLSTDKPSRLYKFANNLYLDTIPKEYYKKYNIYITSDEEIKEGDWIYGLFNGGVILRSKLNIPKHTQHYLEFGLKIILTTDPDLIKDGVQAIDDEFLEWFVKNPSCENVVVITEQYTQNYHKDIWYNRYKIIIPQEEPKQEDFEYVSIGEERIKIPIQEPEQEYQSECICENSCRGFVNVKCKQLNKKETVGEVAERLTKDFPHYSVRDNMDDSDIKGWFLEALQKGAKWQAERMYSEEEVIEFGEIIAWNIVGKTVTESSIRTILKECFKKFKKKQ